MKIVLLNFTHINNRAGGVETRYHLLNRVLSDGGHDVTTIATATMDDNSIQKVLNDADLAISDSAICIKSECPMITIFGNPWQQVLNSLPDRSGWERTNIPSILRQENAWHAKNNTTRIAVSNFMKEQAKQQGIKIDYVIENPMDTSIAEYNKNKLDTCTVLWVGSEADIKRHNTILRIKEEWERKMVYYPLDWKFIYKGGKNEYNRQQIIWLCQHASIVISTSYAEGCSNFLLEALASNTPIITTKTGLFWDWWHDDLGCRVEVDSPIDVFMDSILFVLNNINTFRPRATMIHHGLDYDSWASRWNCLISKVYHGL